MEYFHKILITGGNPFTGYVKSLISQDSYTSFNCLGFLSQVKTLMYINDMIIRCGRQGRCVRTSRTAWFGRPTRGRRGSRPAGKTGTSNKVLMRCYPSCTHLQNKMSCIIPIVYAGIYNPL